MLIALWHRAAGACAVHKPLYEGGPKLAGLRLIPDAFILCLEQLLDAGERDEAVETFMLNATGVCA